MPTYEYHCDTCAKNFDVVQSFQDEALTECPTCGSPVRKVFGNVGIVFKGSGFYKTDSRGTSSAKAADGAGGASGGSDSSSGSDAAASTSSGEGSSSSDSSTKPSTPAAPAPAASGDKGSSPKAAATPS